MSLASHIVLITGAGRGLGRAIALRLAREGLRVALCARTAAEVEEVADTIRARGGQALHGVVDVTNRDSIEAFLGQVRMTWGCVDILVNNAGMGFYKPLIEHSDEELEAVLDTNLKGPVILVKAVLGDMLARGQGQILNIASDLARRPLANMAPYVAAKHGLLGFSASLARELKGQGIKVMTLNSGIVDTSFGGGVEGSREETWSLRPDSLAEIVLTMLNQDPFVLMDEVTVHPLQQDF